MNRKVLSAGVVLVRGSRPPRYLLLRAYRNWDFPKGEVEAGESALSAARREVGEETGLTELHFDWGDDWRETGPYARGKVARYFLARAPSGEVILPVSPKLGRPEHHEACWLSYAEARRRLPARLHPVLDWAHALVAGPASVSTPRPPAG